MQHSPQPWLFILAILLSVVAVHARENLERNERQVKTAVFHSPPFFLGPGLVDDKYFYDMEFPRGHIALKSFNAEVVDEEGNSIPLHETYLHHWAVAKYFELVDSETSTSRTASLGPSLPNRISARNAGICPTTLGQYYGLGSETRGTLTWIPDPYGIEAGNPKEIPRGYKEKWLLNVHAIDTRGVVDKVGCTECKCSLYNATVDSYGHPLKEGYIGGLFCCYDQKQCRVKEGFDGVTRKLYLRYTVKWVDWDDSIVPVKIYIFDVTDTGEKSNDSTSSSGYGCKVEYNVEPCASDGAFNDNCVDDKKAKLVMPRGGDVIYGVAHQHLGGLGSTLYGEDGRVLCSSIPIYGNGTEAGNEAGYIVGMTTCYPQPGTVRIADGETLTLQSNYSNSQMHTGVMGLFYILVAEQQPPKNMLFETSQLHEIFTEANYAWAFLLCAVVAVSVAATYWRRSRREEGYQSLVE